MLRRARLWHAIAAEFARSAVGLIPGPRIPRIPQVDREPASGRRRGRRDRHRRATSSASCSEASSIPHSDVRFGHICPEAVTCSKLLKASVSSLRVLYNGAMATCPVCPNTEGVRIVVRLVPASSSPRHSGRPPAIPAARHAGPAHARTSGAAAPARPRRTSLLHPLGRAPPVGRRLSGPGSGGLVVHGMGGIGKSTLAAQIAARVGRLQASRVMSVIGGEILRGGLRGSGSGQARRTSSSWRTSTTTCPASPAGGPSATPIWPPCLAPGRASC